MTDFLDMSDHLEAANKVIQEVSEGMIPKETELNEIAQITERLDFIIEKIDVVIKRLDKIEKLLTDE